MKYQALSTDPRRPELASPSCREKPVAPETLDNLSESARPGWESPAEQRAAFRWSRIRRWLLEWVRRTMREQLPRIESQAITLVYFEGLSSREAGMRLGVHPSTVIRRCRSGIATLRHIAEIRPPRLPDGSVWRPGDVRYGRKSAPRA